MKMEAVLYWWVVASTWVLSGHGNGCQLFFSFPPLRAPSNLLLTSPKLSFFSTFALDSARQGTHFFPLYPSRNTIPRLRSRHEIPFAPRCHPNATNIGSLRTNIILPRLYIIFNEKLGQQLNHRLPNWFPFFAVATRLYFHSLHSPPWIGPF